MSGYIVMMNGGQIAQFLAGNWTWGVDVFLKKWLCFQNNHIVIIFIDKPIPVGLPISCLNLLLPDCWNIESIMLFT